METRKFQLKRFRGLAESGGETLFFRALGGDRRHPAPFFRTEEVPAFDGDLAWFLAERAPRRGWRIMRRIHPDGRPYEAPAALTAPAKASGDA
jgi:hypothetical protein